MAARRVLGPGVALALALTAAAPAAADLSGTQHIVSGTRISIADAPWQVYLKIGSSGLCGGSILDSTHIVTAAHCTYNGLTPRSPGQIKVVSGASSFDPYTLLPDGGPPDSPVLSPVSAIRSHPGYVASTDGKTDSEHGRDDVAVLTLAAPLDLDGVVRKAVDLPPRNTLLAAGIPLTVTGFGLEQETAKMPDGKLHRLTDMNTLDAATYTGEWNAVYVAATSPTGLDCSGDSGGPLVQQNGTGVTLLGLVAFSPNCSAGTPSVYTSTAPGEIRDFITGTDDPPAAPTGGRDIQMSADKNAVLPLTPGRVLHCAPGTWTHNPQITIRYQDAAGTVLQEGASQDYVITTPDIGRRIGCEALAATEGGVATSPPITLPPAIEAPARASLTVSLRTTTSHVTRGHRIAVMIRLVSRNRNTALNPKACFTLPSRWTVVKRGGADVHGGTVCLHTKTLRTNVLAYTTVTLRPASNAHTGLVRLKVRASADNASSAYGSRTLHVRS